MLYNEFNQPIGSEIKNYNIPLLPNISKLKGNFVKLEKLDEKHITHLFNHFSQKEEWPNWTYLSAEPITDIKFFEEYIRNYINSSEMFFFAIVNNTTDEALGIMALMNIDVKNSSIEVGHIQYSNDLKCTRMATEAQFLLMEYVFDTLGYRRYEWKCDDLNAPSKKSAKRLGFVYEGTFRQHRIYKNRNRDTSWFSILDKEWPRLKRGYKLWLDLSNFDEKGFQKSKLTFDR